jgi:hypothetical protein
VAVPATTVVPPLRAMVGPLRGAATIVGVGAVVPPLRAMVPPLRGEATTVGAGAVLAPLRGAASTGGVMGVLVSRTAAALVVAPAKSTNSATFVPTTTAHRAAIETRPGFSSKLPLAKNHLLFFTGMGPEFNKLRQPRLFPETLESGE